MDGVFLFLRFLLAGVFGVAGAAKLADRAGTRQTMRDFGVPARLSRPLGLLLPSAEITLAAMLLPARTAWWAALGILLLLVVFIVAIGTNLARGRHPRCHCFGEITAEPVGRWTLARNGLIALPALFVVARGPAHPSPDTLAWLRALTASEQVALGFALLVLALLLVIVSLLRNVLARVAELAGRVAQSGTATPEVVVAGLPVGTPAPGFSLPGLDGETVSLAGLRAAGRPVLLIFSDPHCGLCNGLLPYIGEWQRRHGDALTLAVVSRGDPDANRAKARAHNLTNVLLQQESEVSQQYKSWATPTGALISPDGTIAKPLAQGGAAIREIVETIGGTSAATDAHHPAPNHDGFRPKKGEHVRDEYRADGSMTLYHPVFQDVITLNPTAALAWEYCDGTYTLPMIVAEVRDVFPDAPGVEEALDALFHDLRACGMLAADADDREG